MSKAVFLLSVVNFFTIALLWQSQFPISAQNSNPPMNEGGVIDRVEKLERRVNELATNFGVGTVVFCSSETPPGRNWVLCDGKACFPESAPKPLAGKRVPNLQGALVAIGNPNNPRVEGSLARQAVSGDNFILPVTTSKRIAPDKGNAKNPAFKGGLVAVFTANADYLDVKFGTANWSCFGGKMEVEPAVYEYHPKGTKVEGKTYISPPTHVFLQAFVRIR